MKRLLPFLFAVGAAPQGDEPELPPIKKVTLRLDNTPAFEALSRLSRAAGCPMEFHKGRHGVPVSREDEAKVMSLDLKDAPLFDALESFCLAHGNLSYSIGERMQRVSFQGYPVKRTLNAQQGRFLFWHNSVEEEVRFDFSKTVRSCTVEIGVAWQPDLRVLEDGLITITGVIDDTGRPMLAPGATVEDAREFRTWDARGPLRRRVTVPLAPRGARSINLKGWIDLRVPKRGASVELPLDKEPKPVRSGSITFTGSRQGSGEEQSWTYRARLDDGKLTPDQFLDLRNGREDGYEYWIGWGKEGGIRALDDGSVEFTVKERTEDDRWLRFTLVEGKCALRVPFELKEVPLPR